MAIFLFKEVLNCVFTSFLSQCQLRIVNLAYLKMYIYNAFDKKMTSILTHPYKM